MEDPISMTPAMAELAAARGCILAPPAFRTRLDGELRRALRYGRPLSLLVFDLEAGGLSEVDPSGDIAAGIVARIRRSFRDSDVVARRESQGYALLLTETPVKRACEVAVRVVEIVRDLPVDTGEPRLRASVGVAAVTPRMSDADMLISAAEAELSRALSRGGDCISAALGVAVHPTVQNNGQIH